MPFMQEGQGSLIPHLPYAPLEPSPEIKRIVIPRREPRNVLSTVKLPIILILVLSAEQDVENYSLILSLFCALSHTVSRFIETLSLVEMKMREVIAHHNDSTGIL